MAGFVLYEGPSQLDGAPIIVIMTGELTKAASRNTKTGDMWQMWIMRADIEPHHAIKSGEDASVCGDCKRRPMLAKAAGEKPCYVRAFQAPLNVYRSYHRGIYPRIELSQLATILAGRRTRIGSYGDPAAAPLAIWEAVQAASDAVTGYSHQWRDPAYQGYNAMLMASVDNAIEALQALALGWRYFRVAPKGDGAKLEREASCPASKEAGHKTTCAACVACGGLSSKAKVSMVIQAH